MKSQNNIQRQRVRSKKPSRTQSASYEQWRGEQERYDRTGVADPDVLGSTMDEPLGLLEREDMEQECKNKVKVLMGIAKQVLTDKEHEVFVLLAVDFVSMAKAARTISVKYNISISKAAVQDTWERVRAKLNKAYYL